MPLRVPLYSAGLRCIPLRCRCIICSTPLRIPLHSAVRSAALHCMHYLLYATACSVVLRCAFRCIPLCCTAICDLHLFAVFFHCVLLHSAPLYCVVLYLLHALFIPLYSAVFRSAVLSCILCFMPLYSMLLRCVPLSAPLYAICSAAFHSAVLRWIQYLWWLPEKSCGLREASSVASVCFRVDAAASGNCGGRAAQCSPGLNLSLSSYHHSRI